MKTTSKMKRTSEKSDMVTYEDSTQVVKKRRANQHANKMDSRTILILIPVKVTLAGGF